MIKKIIVTSAMFIFSTQFSWAASFYIAPTATYQSLSINNISYEGIAPQLTLGYGGQLKDYFYLAGEIFGNSKSIVIRNKNDNIVSIRPEWAYGGSILPAYLFDYATLGYLRLGFQTTRIDGANVTKTGGQAGIGLQYMLSRCWDVRGEFNYTWYGKVSGLGRLDQAQYLLGFVYRFV